MEQLVVFHPPELAGVVLRLGPGRQLLGRGSHAALRLDDRHLSVTHAAISNVGGRVTVEDLGSSNGTRVGGETFVGAKLLNDGDILTFGGIEARFEQTSEPRTVMLPRQDIHGSQPHSNNFGIGRQEAGQINNVGRDQHNNHIHQQRESFIREAAASRTKARFVFWIGLVLATCGILGYTYFFVKAADEMQTATQKFSDELEASWQTGTPPTDFLGLGVDIFGADTALGIPAGLIFFMVTMVGTIMSGIGLILWIVAAARARGAATDPRHAWNSPIVR